jgi:hypothetical protein
LLTLNQIHAQIVALANAHYQIAEVGMGTIAELQGKPDRLYPLLWLSNEGGSLEDNYKVDNIRLTMFGRVIVGEEGQDDDASEIEVLSDMQLILLDFLNYFHQQHGQEYVTDKAATLEHFTERTNDRTAGYSCVLELKQFYDWNKCNIPQSGAVIPPTIDGLTLYDFCDQSVLDRLTATQVACLEAELCGTCADATVQLNGTTVGTIPSGDSDSFAVNLDGSPSGVWDGTAWQVTSTPCADATVELNGVEMTTIPSGDTENISIRQSSGATEVGSKQGVHWRIDDSAISINGSPVADVKAEDPLDIDVTQDGSPVGSWNGSAWIVPAPIAPSLSIEVYSDAGYTIPVASLAYGATAYIKLVSSDITPTTHTFFFGNGTKNAPQVTQVGDSLAWVITLTGTITISATATDGTDATADATPFTLTSTIVITNSMKFDGVNDTTLATPLITYNQDFSVSFWFKMNSAAITNSLFSMGIKYNSSRLAITVFYNINKIAVLSSGNGWNLNRNVAWTGDTNWHNLIVTNNNSTKAKEVFIDGVSIGIPNNDALSADFDYLMLGYGWGNNYGNVNIADFNIHNSILTAPQIAALQTVGATSANSVQRWIFNEAVGTTSGAVSDIVAGQKMNLRNMLAPNGIVADAP